MDAAIRTLFAGYERGFNAALAEPSAANLGRLRRAFAPYVVGSNPLGVRGSKNGLLFRLMLGRGFARYRRIGMRQMRIEALTVTPIDNQHALSRVRWHSEYERPGTPVSIDFDVTYLIRSGKKGLQIFGFVSGDEEKALRDHGLL